MVLHEVRVPTLRHLILLLVQQRQACCDVAGHQVRVLHRTHQTGEHLTIGLPPDSWYRFHSTKLFWSQRREVSLTEKNPLTSCAMLENAARWPSSCGRQQHSRRSRLSHTLTASERTVDRNWAPSLLCRSRTPSGSAAACGARGSPSGSNTNTTPNPVNSRMIQLL